jgi:hypothetical protein
VFPVAAAYRLGRAGQPETSHAPANLPSRRSLLGRIILENNARIAHEHESVPARSRI